MDRHIERGGNRSFQFLKFLLPILVLALAVVGVVLMSSLKPKPEEKVEPPKAPPVVTARAQNRTVNLSVEAQGEVSPRTEINIASQVGGRISYLAPGFLNGGHFAKNDVLARIDPQEYDLRVIQAQANVAQAETALTREMSEVEIARQDWLDLGEGNASPLTLRAPQLAEAQARLAAMTAGLEEAKLQRSRTVIRAPFDGRVKQRQLSEGEYITPGQVLGRVFSIDIVEVKLALTDEDLGRLGIGVGFMHSEATPGPIARLQASVAGQMRQWEGRLVRTDSNYDSQTRVLFGYIEVIDPYGKNADNGVPLAAGLFVDAVMDGRGIEKSIVVPRAALRGTDTVYLANKDNTLSIKKVIVASSSRTEAILTGGLNGNEQVIISPVKGAAEGMKIAIVENESP